MHSTSSEAAGGEANVIRARERDAATWLNGEEERVELVAY